MSGRKLISRWHRDELGAERKAARRKCLKALAPILDIISKYAVHASLKAVDALRECPAHSAFAIVHGSFARFPGFAAAARGAQSVARREPCGPPQFRPESINLI